MRGSPMVRADLYEVASRRVKAALCAAGLLLSAGCAGEADTIERPLLRVLGTAQDGGLPHASCSCVRCEAARDDPGRRRLVSSLALVTSAGTTHLFDATPDIREQLDLLRDLREQPGRVDRSPLASVWLTHAHMGHYTGLAFFGFEAMHTPDLDLFCSSSMARYLRNNGPWSQLVEMGNVSLNEIAAGQPTSLDGGVTITAINVPHREEYSDTLGFIFEGAARRVLFVPDTDPWRAWDPPLIDQLADIDVALLDGTFYSGTELPGRDLSEIGHPLITSSMDLLEPLVSAGRLEVYFTHLNHSNPALDPASIERREIERRGFHVLRDGQELPF
jgi:pyrroloquinoline quinone biosynthesis protein B